MRRESELVGRSRQLVRIATRLDELAEGRPGVVIVDGEAGVGKTAFLDTALAGRDHLVLRAAASPQVRAPYGPLLSILRNYERMVPGGIAASGPVSPHLSILMPELGPLPEASDQLTLTTALVDAILTIARGGPAVIVLEDMQWSDEATLELLAALGTIPAGVPLLVFLSSRPEEVHRGHGLRRARAELRRAHRLDEIVLAPLNLTETSQLIEQLIDGRPSRDLTRRLFERTGGIPFFLTELVAALASNQQLLERRELVHLASHEVPLPETIRDSVRLRTDRISRSGRTALELAAVAGDEVDFSIFDGEEEEAGLEEILEFGFVVEEREGCGRFRHALVREGIYADTPWSRRRKYHRRIARRLEECGGSPEMIAEHWLGAREPELARPHLLEAARSLCAVHAYRDAARAGRRALDLWPPTDEKGRLEVLEQLGHCAEISSDLSEAARAWEEVRDVFAGSGQHEELAVTARRLAGVYELQGMPERTRMAREEAAAAFESCGRVADAIVERLAVAERLELAGSGHAALAIVAGLAPQIEAAGSEPLRIRALAIEGEFRAKLGEREVGIAQARQALALALAEEDTATAAEAYYRLGAALENACEHDGAVEAYTAARGFCIDQKIEGLAQICFACMLPALLLTGQWARMTDVCKTVLRSPHAPPVARAKANGHLGIVAAIRGKVTRARRLLEECYAFSQREAIVPIEVFCTWGLARALVLMGDTDSALERCRELVRRAARRDEQHYSVPPLRWASTLFALHGDARQVGACADILADIASATAHPECLGPMSHAMGELALLNGEPDTAAEQFEQAVRLMSEAGIPYERAETLLRHGVALSAAGRQQEAVERITEAQRTARRLGARPLVADAARALDAIGGPVASHSAPQPSSRTAETMLSPRENEVLRLVADGLTNRQIADRLYISKRTVDMHVRNVLGRLGCRSRIDATTRARSMQILP